MDPRTGRTFWDFLHDLVRSPRAMSMIAASLLLAVGTLWYVVHTHAEPGTPISLVGMIQYQKAKSPDKPVDVGAISSAQTDEIRSLKTRIVDLLRIPTVERRTLTSQVDKLTKDIGERDRQIAELKNAAASAEQSKAASESPFPTLQIWIFKWLLTDDKCKLRAGEAIQEAGGAHVRTDNFAAMGRKGQNNITILCNSPSYAVIVAGTDGNVARDIRDAVAAVMTK